MPMILNPAHETSTLLTVLNRCMTLADGLGKKHVVLTVDQALYCKLIEMHWMSDDFQEHIVLRMGGLHIALNFLKVIGKHMAGSGLSEIWLESGVLAEGSITKVMEGKAYGKGMRVHKLTFQALWRILYPQILDFLETHDVNKAEELKSATPSTYELEELLECNDMRNHLSKFFKQWCEEDATFSY